MRNRSEEFLFDDILHWLLLAHNASHITVTAKYLASSMLLQAHTIQKHLTCITLLF